MTDYSNMSRGEAVERCIGLEIEREIDQRLGNHMIAQNKKLVHTLEGYDKRIAELGKALQEASEALIFYLPRGNISAHNLMMSRIDAALANQEQKP